MAFLLEGHFFCSFNLYFAACILSYSSNAKSNRKLNRPIKVAHIILTVLSTKTANFMDKSHKMMLVSTKTANSMDTTHLKALLSTKTAISMDRSHKRMLVSTKTANSMATSQLKALLSTKTAISMDTTPF